MTHIFENVIQELEYKADPEAFRKKLNGQPVFLGQGGCKSVGSDAYGFYLVEKKVLPNGKTIWGYSRTKSHFEKSWTDGSMICEGPVSWKAEQWIIARGNVKRHGKKLDVPQWWHCDENGNRIADSKCNISWNGCYEYLNPSF